MLCCCSEKPAPYSVVEVSNNQGSYTAAPEPEPKVVENPEPEPKVVENPEPDVKEPPPPPAPPVTEEPAPEEPPPPAAAPVPVQVDDGKVEFGFTDETGKMINLRFGKRPLGMNFHLEIMPIVITSFKPGSHAQECGAKVGMTLATIEGDSVAGMSYSVAFQKINDTLKKLPHDGKVEFGFTDETGKMINLRFGATPLGMNFTPEKMPIVITSFKPGSHAQECGAKVGMTLATIEGNGVKGISYSAACEKINDAIKNLPSQQA